MIWKRAVLISLLTISGLAVQTSVFRTGSLIGTKPPLMLLVTIAVALGEGAAAGATTGFVAGLCTDLLMPYPVGITPLVYTIIGYVVGRARTAMADPTVWMPVAMVFGGTLVGVMAYGGLSALLGVVVAPPGVLFRHAALGAVYNALLTPFLFPLVRALGRRLRPGGQLLEGPTIKPAP